jgi:hypothetical protein
MKYEDITNKKDGKHVYMCSNCNDIKTIVVQNQSGFSEVYTELHSKFEVAVANREIELVAGDCELSEITQRLNSEMHYTVFHYFRCLKCGETFSIGACIRGKPFYRHGVEIPSFRSLKKKLWGRVGTVFENRKWWQIF